MKEKLTLAQYNKIARPGMQRRSKYGNIKTEYNGKVYHSKKEADFASHLEYLKHAKNLSERVVSVREQVPYNINIKSHHICTYFADFVIQYGDKRTEVIDVKGVKTAIYRLKKRMVEASYGIIIKEV